MTERLASNRYMAVELKDVTIERVNATMAAYADAGWELVSANSAVAVGINHHEIRYTMFWKGPPGAEQDAPASSLAGANPSAQLQHGSVYVEVNLQEDCTGVLGFYEDGFRMATIQGVAVPAGVARDVVGAQVVAGPPVTADQGRLTFSSVTGHQVDFNGVIREDGSLAMEVYAHYSDRTFSRIYTPLPD